MTGEPISIPLTRGYVATIDAIDAHLAQYKWCAHVRRNNVVYAVRHKPGSKGSTLSLHREVLCEGDPKRHVDHIDGNGLNCTRANLRSGRNRASRSNPNNKASPYLGVCWIARSERYAAQIKVNRKNHVLGYFHTAEEANQARLEGERRLWGTQPRRKNAHGCGQ